MTTAALLLAALLAGPHGEANGGPAPHPASPTRPSVLAEMAPAPGRWEVEDAPAYFSDRTGMIDAPAAMRPREGEALVARRP